MTRRVGTSPREEKSVYLVLGIVPSVVQNELVPRGLRLIATRGVAKRLSYSERTIKNVVHDIVTKLNARTRSHAVAAAVREGLI